MLGALASGGPATGAVTRAPLYAGYAPAGSFSLRVDGQAVAGKPAFSWAAQYAVPKGQASLALSQFPLVPLAVFLELALWVALAVALVGRPRRSPGGHHDGPSTEARCTAGA